MKRLFATLLIAACAAYAAAYDAYVTFKGTTAGPVDAFYTTQSAANTAATDNAYIVAHVGKLDVGELTPNEAYFDGSSVVADTAAEAAYLEGLTEVEKLQNAFRALHDGLINAAMFLETPNIKLYYPDADRQIGHDMLALTHRAARGIGLSTHWTSTQKFAWIAGMVLGPTDVSFAQGLEGAAAAFFEIIEESRMGEEPILAPTSYFMWVDPNDGDRWDLTVAAEGIPQPTLDNFAAAATDFTIFRNGAWIASVTIADE